MLYYGTVVVDTVVVVLIISDLTFYRDSWIKCALQINMVLQWEKIELTIEHQSCIPF